MAHSVRPILDRMSTTQRELFSAVRHPSLRLRITAWYVLVLGLTAVIIGGLFYIELERSLFASVDLSLRAALSQAVSTIEADPRLPAFRDRNDVDVVVQNRGRTDFAVRLLSVRGTIADGAGAYRSGPQWPQPHEGFATVQGRGGRWRVLTEPILAREEPVLGWIQVAQPIAYITDAVDRLRAVLVLAIPLMLLLAGAGGVLLVHEALRPISKVTATAQSISSSDLSQRIAYDGPDDEIARLARTFDRMLDRLEEGFELERRFTADASHELRTPLTALIGQLEVAISRSRTAAEYQRILASLKTEANRLIGITNDLLLLSRIGLSNHTPTTTAIDLSDLVQATVEQFASLMEVKGIRMSLHGTERPIPIVGDFDQLVRLFLNLFDNAVKYTPPGGEIAVTLGEPANRWASVAVSNTGPGFPPEDGERLFERFYRVHSDRARDSGGSGLGLAIAREIVRAHGGRIRAESVPGGRTTFTVELPKKRNE